MFRNVQIVVARRLDLYIILHTADASAANYKERNMDQLNTIITELRGMREDVSAALATTKQAIDAEELLDAALPFAQQYDLAAMGDLEGYVPVQITVSVGQLRRLIAGIASITE
jgi:hypothetical protein